MQTIFQLQGIRHAALAIAYDNGMINRECSETEFLHRCDSVVGADGVDYADLVKMDTFLRTLTDEQMDELCAGEETEQSVVLSLYEGDREQLNGFLNDLFEA